jgi:lipopolysaccharide export system permease protein
MKLKIYKTYILKSYLYYFLIVSLIFTLLSFFLNILEEIAFFEKYEVGLYYPIFLTLLNTPSILFEIFPFIFLIASQLFFVKFRENEELNLLKVTGIDNFSLIRLLVYLTLVMGIIITVLFYSFSSNLKHNYLLIKNKFTDDKKYLAAINDNGLWIKDEINNEIYIINGVSKKDPFLEDVFISKFNSNFDLIENIFAKNVDISNNTWIIENPTIFRNNRQTNLEKNILLNTHFNIKKINSAFRNLNSFNLFQLVDIKNENMLLGYSSQDIDLHFLKIISIPFYFTILVIISSLIMLNIKKNKPYIFHVLLGISLSVIIYYINNIFNVFGLTNKIPIYLSIFFPMIFLGIISIVGLIRINEK